MSKITTILFDFDGTIMNTNEVVIKSWQHTFRTVEGKERPVESIVSTFENLSSRPWPGSFLRYPWRRACEYIGVLLEHYDEMIHPFPGMVDLICKLKERGYKTGLVTSRVGDTAVQGLEQFGLCPIWIVW